MNDYLILPSKVVKITIIFSVLLIGCCGHSSTNHSNKKPIRHTSHIDDLLEEAKKQNANTKEISKKAHALLNLYLGVDATDGLGLVPELDMIDLQREEAINLLTVGENKMREANSMYEAAIRTDWGSVHHTTREKIESMRSQAIESLTLSISRFFRLEQKYRQTMFKLEAK